MVKRKTGMIKNVSNDNNINASSEIFNKCKLPSLKMMDIKKNETFMQQISNRNSQGGILSFLYVVVVCLCINLFILLFLKESDDKISVKQKQRPAKGSWALIIGMKIS